MPRSPSSAPALPDRAGSPHPATPQGDATRNLASLFEREIGGTVCPVNGITGAVQVSEGTGPKWMEKPGRDLFGLAFSGGGIRSATFNLGVLQGLNRLGLLECFDYFATVSGGGYIGGFWTAWKKAAEPGQLPAGERGEDAPEIRHLRVFSNFLIPRLGLLSYDTGRAVVTVLCSIVPSLLASLALIALAVLAWVLLAWVLFSPGANAFVDNHPLPGYLLGGSVALAAMATAGVLAVRNRGRLKGDASHGGRRTALWLAGALGIGWMGISALGSFEPAAAMMLGITAVALVALEVAWQSRGETSPVWSAVLAGVLGMVLTSVAWRMGMRPWLDGFYASGQLLPVLRPTQAPGDWLKLFAPPAAWAAGAAVFVALRLAVAPWVASRAWLRAWRGAADRVQSRLLLLMAAWSLVAVLWCAGVVLEHLVVSRGQASAGAAGVAGVAAALSAVFAKVQHLLGRAKKPAESAKLRQRLMPVLPKILAYLVLAIMVMGVVALIAAGAAGGDLSYAPGTVAAAAGAITLLALVFLDPNEVGLHSFYRGRLARAYLGAVNRAGGSRTEEQPGDDFPLKAVPEHVRPLHLVCCTANDLAFGERMSNLSRGGVAGVLSRHGFQVGDCWAPWSDFRRGAPSLASSVTASGAAFNTLMGALSIQYGRGVSFLMATLNLRLGLWLPHPLHANQARGTLLPGFPFYRELFGQARANGWQVHLSDGGHSENTGIYELVRRHCRVIVATDCGADPEGNFADLGNVVRRVRIDFGVDIRIDPSPLKPDEHGRARQYMVAGDIHYPGGDTGVLLLLKPAIVGSEPPDVAQYRSRNPAFPHESTGDQFYSEAQWESYRRLGEHASVTAFEAVVEPARHGTRRLPEWMATFARARREWQPKPDGYDARLSRFADRVAELDAVLRQPGSERLLAEVYKEVGELDRSGRTQTVAAAGSAGTASASGDGHGGADATSLPDGRAHAGADAVAGAISSGFRLAVAAIRAVGRDGPPAAPDAAPDEAELTHALYLMRRVLLLMVEVYETEDLEKNSRHPLYLGVMNWFARWAYAPSFRMWWPLLKALYPQPFTRFLEASFALPTVERATGPDGAVAVAVDEAGEGFAMSAWRRQRSREPGAGDHVVSFRLKMRYRERQDYSLQAAQVIARREGATAWWDARDFFVPPGLWGIGIGNAFLEKLADEKLGALGDDGTSPRWLAVCVRYGADDRKRGADELQLYRGAGFCEARVAGGELTFAGEPILRLPAEHAAPGEAVQWVVLDRGIQPVGSGSIAAAATEPASAGA